MLKRIYDDNFRALVNFELRAEQLSLFLGDNGSGKSTLFNVLGALSDQIVRGAKLSKSMHFDASVLSAAEARRYYREEEPSVSPHFE